MGKVITIDGPAASGKTSVSRELARRLGWKWVSTGAFYRGLALLALRNNIDLDDEEALTVLASQGDWQVKMDSDRTRVYFAELDVTDEVVREEAGNAASRISQLPKVRESLLQKQRNCSQQAVGGLIAEGRDCGTVVFPQAEIRVYLTAHQAHRAQRRAVEQGLSPEQTAAEQSARDQQDSTRKAAPLRIPGDAYVLDTTKLGLDQVVSLLEEHVRETLGFSL